jgi:glutamate synthase (NADPH/NADH) small chain
MLVAATRQVHGPDSMGIVAATGCNSVFGATYPFNPYQVPWTNSLFENAPADALGIRARWDQEGFPERRLWVIGGDGAMYDIGFQSLSRMVASGADIKVLVLDTQVYSNTGGQASTASYGGQVTKLSAFGKAQHGRPERRKELGRIMMAHGEVYVAQTTPAHLNHFYRSILEANEYPGPAVVIAYGPCMPEHGIADDAGAAHARAAVDSRAFPLFTYDPRRGPTMASRLSLQGNPAVGEDWHRLPDGTTFDFLSFARTEGRFAAHFAADGTPTPEIVATRDERLANWRQLQELAGAGPMEQPARRPFVETTPTLTLEEVQQLAARCIQCPDPTCVKGCPIRVEIPRYLERVVAGDLEGAARSLLGDNPLARVTGRVCAHEVQCEGSCVLEPKGGPVAIGAIERFVADWARDHLPAAPAVASTGRSVAVVGSGPGGLACAGELAERGHAVTVLDAYPVAGGVLRYGIPGFRLGKRLVNDEVMRLRDRGVRFELDTRVGDEITLAELQERFDAVFLAVGLGASVLPEVPGAALAGVVDANAYLERVNALGEGIGPELRGRHVAVLGAGNTAMDATRAALRLGAETVTVVYRRGRAEIPAAAAEVLAAESEGARFELLATPVELLSDADGRVRRLRCERMHLGEPDASGRPAPIGTGETFELAADLVIAAIGSRPGVRFPELATDAAGRLQVDAEGRTSLPHLYAGGDIVRGAATVVEAVRDGKVAAATIDRELRGA